MENILGPFKKYVTLFWPILDPHPPPHLSRCDETFLIFKNKLFNEIFLFKTVQKIIVQRHKMSHDTLVNPLPCFASW